MRELCQDARNDVDDGSQVGPLLDQAAGPVASFTDDGASDRHDVSGRSPSTNRGDWHARETSGCQVRGGHRKDDRIAFLPRCRTTKPRPGRKPLPTCAPRSWNSPRNFAGKFSVRCCAGMKNGGTRACTAVWCTSDDAARSRTGITKSESTGPIRAPQPRRDHHGPIQASDRPQASCQDPARPARRGRHRRQRAQPHDPDRKACHRPRMLTSRDWGELSLLQRQSASHEPRRG